MWGHTHVQPQMVTSRSYMGYCQPWSPVCSPSVGNVTLSELENFTRNNMYTTKALECPFQDFSASDKEDNSGKVQQKPFPHIEGGRCRSKRKLQDQIKTSYITVNGKYSHGEDSIIDEDQPVQSFLSYVEIKEEPADNSSCGNGILSTSLDDTLSSSENSSFSSCPLYPEHENRTALDLLYDSAGANPVIQIKLSQAAAAQRERRRRHLEKMTEEERQAKRARAAAQQRKKRQQLLECMTEEQRRAYRAAIAEAQRIRRHIKLQRMSDEEKQRQRSIESALSAKRRRLRQEKMTEEELRAYRAAAAAAQRRKRLIQREQMTEEELRELRATEAARRRRLRQTNVTEDSGSQYRTAAAVRRVSRQRHKEKWMEEEQVKQCAAAPMQQDFCHYRKEITSDAPQASVVGETTPEDLMMQILMQAQNAAAHECGPEQNGDIKQELVEAYYSQQERTANEHHLSSYVVNQPYREMSEHERKDIFY